MTSHAILSASGSKKWLNCPLSIQLEKEFPDTTSKYAQEGTNAHSLGELKIKYELGFLNVSEYIKLQNELLMSLDKETISEMEYYTTQYADYVVERFNSYNSNYKEIGIESRLDYSRWAPEGFGTGDIVLYTDKTVEIIDLKYGKGVKVDAYQNSQLKLYGLGALEEYDLMGEVENVILTVYQPRIDNISSFEISTIELYEWAENEVKPKAIKALKGEGECVAGEHCVAGFCKARQRCKAFADYHLDLQRYEYKNPSLLSDEELVDIVEVSETLKNWVETVKTYVLSEVLNGREFNGLKVVEGRSFRKITNTDTALKLLTSAGYEEDELIDKKLKSITSLEKIAGKAQLLELLGGLVEKPKGNPNIGER